MGPAIVYFGIANTNGCAACNDAGGQCQCEGLPSPTPLTDSEGRLIFPRLPQTSYLVVIEAKPGGSGLSVATTTQPTNPETRPDLQVEANRDLGGGGTLVDCRSGLPLGEWGGIPGIDPPDFGTTPGLTDVLTDFACRFQVFQPGQPCTLDGNGQASFLNPNPTDQSVRQFCHLVDTKSSFPDGDTILTAQVLDQGQNPGPTAQIVVRVATPAP